MRFGLYLLKIKVLKDGRFLIYWVDDRLNKYLVLIDVIFGALRFRFLFFYGSLLLKIIGIYYLPTPPKNYKLVIKLKIGSVPETDSIKIKL